MRSLSVGCCLVVEVKQFYAGPVIDVIVNNLLEAVFGDAVVGHRVSGVVDFLVLVQPCLHRVPGRLLGPAQHTFQVINVPALFVSLRVRPRAQLLRFGRRVTPLSLQEGLPA